MDLQELHQRTGIPRRKLRYCLDHGLAPGLTIEIAADEAGRPRRFHWDVGFAIVCAARLLELGLPHERIRGFLSGVLTIEVVGKGPAKKAIVAILERRIAARAHLGDGQYVRVTAPDFHYDSGWLAPGTPSALPPQYRPVVELTLDLEAILRQVADPL